ncbi:hypothetical protein PG995_007652 [Apiospora arundinis]
MITSNQSGAVEVRLQTGLVSMEWRSVRPINSAPKPHPDLTSLTKQEASRVAADVSGRTMDNIIPFRHLLASSGKHARALTRLPQIVAGKEHVPALSLELPWSCSGATQATLERAGATQSYPGAALELPKATLELPWSAAIATPQHRIDPRAWAVQHRLNQLPASHAIATFKRHIQAPPSIEALPHQHGVAKCSRSCRNALLLGRKFLLGTSAHHVRNAEGAVALVPVLPVLPSITHHIRNAGGPQSP